MLPCFLSTAQTLVEKVGGCWWTGMVFHNATFPAAKATLNCKETTQNRISTCQKLDQWSFEKSQVSPCLEWFGMLLFAISYCWRIASTESRFAWFCLKWLDASSGTPNWSENVGNVWAPCFEKLQLCFLEAAIRTAWASQHTSSMGQCRLAFLSSQSDLISDTMRHTKAILAHVHFASHLHKRKTPGNISFHPKQRKPGIHDIKWFFILVFPVPFLLLVNSLQVRSWQCLLRSAALPRWPRLVPRFIKLLRVPLNHHRFENCQYKPDTVHGGTKDRWKEMIELLSKWNA